MAQTNFTADLEMTESLLVRVAKGTLVRILSTVDQVLILLL